MKHARFIYVSNYLITLIKKQLGFLMDKDVPYITGHRSLWSYKVQFPYVSDVSISILR